MLRKMVIACFVLIVGCSSCSLVSTSANPESADYRTPLASYVGLDYNPYNAGTQAALQVKIAEATKQCMAEQGFEWRPDQDETRFLVEPDDGLEVGSEAWVDKYGFGFSTLAFPQSSVGPDLVGYPDDLYIDESEYESYESYLDSLSPAEEEAYNEALHGIDEESESESETSTGDGTEAATAEHVADDNSVDCSRSARREQHNEVLSQINLVLGQEISAMGRDAWEDPRIAEQAETVTSCLADKGYPEAKELEAESRGELWPLADEVASGHSAYEESTELALPELTDDQKTELGNIQTREIAAAKVAMECGYPIRLIPASHIEILAENEERFIEEHRDTIDAIKAKTADESDSGN